MSVRDSHRRSKGNLVLLPAGGCNLKFLGDKGLLVLVPVIVNEFHAKFLPCATSPNAEGIFSILLQAHAEEALVLNSGVLVGVSRRLQTHIVGVAVKGAVIAHANLAGDIPTHQILGELERAVFNQLGINTAICGKIDVFEEETVHCALDWSPNLVGGDVNCVTTSGLRASGKSQSR